jgi:hypothetical protein
MTDVDPTSDIGEDVDEADAPTCAVTGEAIVEEESHRVLSWVADGQVEQIHFSAPEHRDAWIEEHGDPPYDLEE